MTLLNNREIASLLWLSVILVFCCRSETVRRSLADVISALLCPELVSVFVIYVEYALVGVLLLWTVGYWKLAMLKATLQWLLLVGTVLCVRQIADSKTDAFSWSFVSDNIKVIAVLQFFSGVAVFAFVVELFLVPFVALLSMTLVVAERREDSQQARTLIEALLAVIGFSLLAIGCSQALHQNGLATYLIEFSLPILMSIWVAPLAYLLALYSAYDQIWTRQTAGPEKEGAFLFFSTWHIPWRLGLSLVRVRRFLRLYSTDLMHATTRGELSRILRISRGDPRKSRQSASSVSHS